MAAPKKPVVDENTIYIPGKTDDSDVIAWYDVEEFECF